MKTVLFLCTHNAARSILAEAILNDIAGAQFRAYSAGTNPAPVPHPLAIETLRRHGHPIGDARSKGIDEFLGAGAPTLDYVITLCDRAAKESCPHWKGQPELAHWRLPNPAAVEGSTDEKRAAFEALYETLLGGLRIFSQDDSRSLARMALVQ